MNQVKMMNFFRDHWHDIGLVLAVGAGVFLYTGTPGVLSLLLWASLISLFLHQFEEYRYPGYFPGVLNSSIFSSRQPDRFPLNTNTSLIVNVTGWLLYFLAAVLAENALWLGIATIVVSAGNFIAHTFIFNIKGKTFYNPGMLSSVVLFLPISVFFFYWVIRNHLATPADWILGFILGIALSFGILKLVVMLKDEKTRHIFPERSLIRNNKK